MKRTEDQIGLKIQNLRDENMKKFIPITIFGIAMGFLEAVVVVYLRALLYPEGFCFPLKDMPLNLLLCELGREVSTIIMLATVGIIAGKNFIEKFSYFVYSFGFWDITYYFWLKVILNWPPSLLTDDILFLIPVPWVGPVVAPIIVSLTMIIFATTTIYLHEKGFVLKLTTFDIVLLFFACVIIFVSFILNYPQVLAHKLPSGYHWELLVLGELLSITVFVKNVFGKKTKK